MLKTLQSKVFVITLLTLAVFAFSTFDMEAKAGTSQTKNQTVKHKSAANTSQKMSAKATSVKKIDINKAGVKDLEMLKGVGPKLAGEIVEYRKTNGPFKSIKDLMKVKGIGPKKFESLKNYIGVK